MTFSLAPSFTRLIPEDDQHERPVCDHCGFINYQNPKIVTGSVVRHQGRILMCRRAIEPRKGYWTIPAGYLEMYETPEDGARREALEEANAQLELHSLLAVYTVPRLSQVQLMYRATLAVPEYSAGVESLEVALMDWSEIPWDDIAFPTVHWVLHHDRLVETGEAQGPFTNPENASTDLPR